MYLSKHILLFIKCLHKFDSLQYIAALARKLMFISGLYSSLLAIHTIEENNYFQNILLMIEFKQFLLYIIFIKESSKTSYCKMFCVVYL